MRKHIRKLSWDRNPVSGIAQISGGWVRLPKSTQTMWSDETRQLISYRTLYAWWSMVVLASRNRAASLLLGLDRLPNTNLYWHKYCKPITTIIIKTEQNKSLCNSELWGWKMIPPRSSIWVTWNRHHSHGPAGPKGMTDRWLVLNSCTVHHVTIIISECNLTSLNLNPERFRFQSLELQNGLHLKGCTSVSLCSRESPECTHSLLKEAASILIQSLVISQKVKDGGNKVASM